MWPPFWPFVILLACTQVANAEAPPGKRKHTLNLFTKRWDWKEASDESKTEWGIVLKRCYMVDTLFFQLQRLLSETLGLREDSVPELSKVTMKHIQKVMVKVDMNLKKATEDQHTSDVTFANMEKDSKVNKLTAQERRSLLEEHNRERHGFSVVAVDAQTALQNAQDFLCTLQACSHPGVNSSHVCGNDTSVNKTLLSKPGNVTTANRTLLSRPCESVKDLKALLQKFETSAATFHQDVLNFEAAQHKALAKLLTTHSTMRRSVIRGLSLLSTETQLPAW
jgi:hypothetical protein